ncbi:BrnA antitoxin family protein [Rhizobium tubonense]|uniref:BrnA antitoxin family protein n=1 Tax=Rhizobium tubonense TaxID=484088 RepID=A0A2W4D2U8_9HYPH|nr:BrnA antitoxin family protein [Rhizobium tubonense]PZM17178.1 hypothetical protein CPY51_02830 [Rhizobium tubonense]
MTANSTPIKTGWKDPDDAPDLSLPEWADRINSAPFKRGRPNSDNPKTSTTIRLDSDIIDRFRAGGPGWQSRINAALRDWLADH